MSMKSKLRRSDLLIGQAAPPELIVSQATGSTNSSVLPEFGGTNRKALEAKRGRISGIRIDRKTYSRWMQMKTAWAAMTLRIACVIWWRRRGGRSVRGN